VANESLFMKVKSFRHDIYALFELELPFVPWLGSLDNPNINALQQTKS
jgi:hypothetical protein